MASGPQLHRVVSKPQPLPGGAISLKKKLRACAGRKLRACSWSKTPRLVENSSHADSRVSVRAL